MRKNIRRLYSFTYIVRKWLNGIGCGYCYKCHRALPLTDMVADATDKWPRRCKVCLREYAKADYASGRRAAYIKRWTEANLEKFKTYQREWRRNRCNYKRLEDGKFRPDTFIGLVRGWLSTINYGYCRVCHMATPLIDMIDNKSSKRKYRNLCKTCARTRKRVDNLTVK